MPLSQHRTEGGTSRERSPAESRTWSWAWTPTWTRTLRAICDARGRGVVTQLQVPATTAGYVRCSMPRPGEPPGPPVELLHRPSGTSPGSYGLSLAAHLAAQGEHVSEIDCSRHIGKRRAGKSDPINAVRAARELLSRPVANLVDDQQRDAAEAGELILKPATFSIVKDREPADPLRDHRRRHVRPLRQQLPDPRISRISDRPLRPALILRRPLRSRGPPTVFRPIPSLRAIARTGMPSARCSRRISAQSSTLITPHYQGGRVHFQPPAPVQDSPADDSVNLTPGDRMNTASTSVSPCAPLRRLPGPAKRCRKSNDSSRPPGHQLLSKLADIRCRYSWTRPTPQLTPIQSARWSPGLALGMGIDAG